jgi:hypothetical protein
MHWAQKPRFQDIDRASSGAQKHPRQLEPKRKCGMHLPIAFRTLKSKKPVELTPSGQHLPAQELQLSFRISC